MPEPSGALRELIATYRATSVDFEHLKAVTLAQWILESGWGGSALATEHNNFGGLKWRKEMAPFARRVRYEAHDGVAYYCHFHDHGSFIKGFWAFLDRKPYDGWRDHAADADDFISFVGPIYAEDPAYPEKVLDLLPFAEELLGETAGGSEASADLAGELRRSMAPGGGAQGASEAADAASAPQTLKGSTFERAALLSHLLDHVDEADPVVGSSRLAATSAGTKPTVDRTILTTHQESRSGTDIDRIVLHYTTSRNIEGTITHFKNGSVIDGRLVRTSAHYIVGRDGELVQMVKDQDAAWHAGRQAMNLRSIGIEHVAQPGDKITSQQERTSLALLRWLCSEYGIDRDDIIPHNDVKPTSCPGDLFDDYGDEQTTAIRKWLAAKW